MSKLGNYGVSSPPALTEHEILRLEIAAKLAWATRSAESDSGYYGSADYLRGYRDALRDIEEHSDRIRGIKR